jgi:nucleoside-diphosphate kinase
MQRTFSIIKPDAVRKGYSAAILAEIEKAGFKIVAIKKMFLSKSQAQGFYAVHAKRPFFDSLTSFMSSGSIIAMVLEKENAIADLRKLMGATNPADAAERAPSASSSPAPSKRMPFTAPTPRIRRPSRSVTSLPGTS